MYEDSLFVILLENLICPKYMPALIFKFRRGKNDQFPKPMP